MLNKSQLRKSQEKSPIREKKGNKFVLKHREKIINKVKKITSNEFDNLKLDIDEINFDNTTITKEGINFLTLHNIYNLSDKQKRNNFKGINLHDIKHIGIFGNDFFYIFLNKEDLHGDNFDFLELESNNLLFNYLVNTLNEEFNVYINKTIEYSKIYSKNNNFLEYYPIIVDYLKLYKTHNDAEIADLYYLTKINKQDINSLLSNYDDNYKSKIINKSQEIKKILDFVNNNKKISAELMVIHDFVENYSSFFTNLLQKLNEILVNTILIYSKYKENYFIINNQKFKIKSINEKIKQLFGSSFGKFHIDKKFIFYGLYGGDINLKNNIKKVTINQNLGRIFSNITLNIREHAFGNDFNGKEKNVIINGYFNKDGSYTLEFIDNGRGISEEELANVFIEGETIKKEKEGHGVAMAAYKEEMKNLGGDITVKSEGLGKGATFSVLIPKNLIISD